MDSFAVLLYGFVVPHPSFNTCRSLTIHYARFFHFNSRGQRFRSRFQDLLKPRVQRDRMSSLGDQLRTTLWDPQIQNTTIDLIWRVSCHEDRAGQDHEFFEKVQTFCELFGNIQPFQVGIQNREVRRWTEEGYFPVQNGAIADQCSCC